MGLIISFKFIYDLSVYLTTSQHVYLSACLPVFTSICLDAHLLPVYVSACLPPYLYTDLSADLFTNLPIYQFTILIFYLYIRLLFHFFTWLPVHLCYRPAAYLSTCLPVVTTNMLSSLFFFITSFLLIYLFTCYQFCYLYMIINILYYPNIKQVASAIFPFDKLHDRPDM